MKLNPGLSFKYGNACISSNENKKSKSQIRHFFNYLTSLRLTYTIINDHSYPLKIEINYANYMYTQSRYKELSS